MLLAIQKGFESRPSLLRPSSSMYKGQEMKKTLHDTLG
jgi:hypothetical protein